MAHYGNILEEELKNKVAKDWFQRYDTTQIIGKIDFCVSVPVGDGPQLFETESLLWAEAKKGTRQDIWESFVQLILTIGRARTFDHHLPPAFLGAFDAEKIAFVPYNNVFDYFYKSDFDWTVAPSDHQTKEFKQLYALVSDTLHSGAVLYSFKEDEKELRHFIRNNFIVGKSGQTKVRINKNNFTNIYHKWREHVMPTISVDWNLLKKNNILEGDFYLADILAEHNLSLRDKLNVLLRNDHYELERHTNTFTGLETSSNAWFSDKQVAHSEFWNRYKRPPKREYWDYIVERRDLLVSQDVRERKGSYFTPQKWVQLSQEYLAAELGEDWQDEYVIWDCAAGTGNLLAGLTNKYNIWASTLDKADVDVMHDRIRQGANLLDSHVFQFDFLNDSFDKLPDGLRQVVFDPERRKKLVVYINPPYAEAGNAKQLAGNGENKTNVAVKTKIYSRYLHEIGLAGRELYAQFFIRIYRELPSVVLAEFSKLKILQAPNFGQFRTHFRAKLGRFFIVPANTFDNVKGNFPIGFFIWHTSEIGSYDVVHADVYNAQSERIGRKSIYCDKEEMGNIGKWLSTFKDDKSLRLGFMSNGRNDFQNQKLVYFMNDKAQMPTPRGWWITPLNVVQMMIFVAVRHSIAADWLNDRDQFLFPSNDCMDDEEFKANCLIYGIFSMQNTIRSNYGTNHWIPFTEEEVDAKDNFESHFMSNFLNGEYTLEDKSSEGMKWLSTEYNYTSNGFTPLRYMTGAARNVLNCGRELWRYYHQQETSNANASLYDIRLYFQGTKTDKKGKEVMNNDSTDEHYNILIGNLRNALRELACEIRPKVYEYGFLKK